MILATGSELRFTDHVDNAIAFVDAQGDVKLSANLTYDGSAALAVTGSVTATTTMQGTTITATTAFVPDASDGAALGTSALQFSDLFLADAAVIGLGDDQDVTITHVVQLYCQMLALLVVLVIQTQLVFQVLVLLVLLQQLLQQTQRLVH